MIKCNCLETFKKGFNRYENYNTFSTLFINTKYYSVKLYRQTKSTKFLCRRYKISKASLMRWNKLFDGTKESLLNKSHKPLSKHPNDHTDEELKWIKDYMRRNPNITLPELYGKLRTDKGYSRHACSLFRVMRKLGYFVNKEKQKKQRQA